MQCEQGLTFTSKQDETRAQSSHLHQPQNTSVMICFWITSAHLSSQSWSVRLSVCSFVDPSLSIYTVFPYCMYMFIANEGFFIHKSCLIVNSKACDDIQLNILDIKAWFDCWYTAIINRQSFYDNYRFFFSQCLCLTYMKYTNTTIHLDLDKV